MNEGSLVVAYHGCDVTTRDLLVSGKLRSLTPSTNVYDWLGPGVYFFENDRERAQQFAVTAHERPEKSYTKRPIATPSVVGAILCVSRWIDMTTQAGIVAWQRGYEQLEAIAAESGGQIPKNERADVDDETILLRQLDCAVFTALHALMKSSGRPPIQAVRGAFYQGEPLLNTSSEFRTLSHVQIAVHDTACVLGWFLPENTALLSEDAFAEARKAQDAAVAGKTASKPRQRAGSTRNG